ncbi:MAG: alpha-amylase/4-alpha-glucanotransferase domain-containing protein [Terriglobales bacterium]
MPIALALLVHAHQPVGNFEAVLERNYATSYAPFLQAAARRPWLRWNLHVSGYLLEWLRQRHPDWLDQTRALVTAGRLEILGGGYYEPILAAIPAAHQQAQLARLAEAVEAWSGERPRGAWLAERVWEPQVAAALAQAGLNYTVLDDSHFERAGVAPPIHGYWRTEEQGQALALVPSSLFLRQAIPFRPPADALTFMREAAGAHPGSLLTMGDDLEKFGSWPHTFQHVWREGWMEQFLDGLEAAQDQIQTVRLSDHLARQPPRGLVYVPTGSYPEMMRWAGSATWRGFLTRYREANLLHKRGWDLDRRVALAGGCAAASEHLLAAECNDAYWHGWFGGVYSPHLRHQAFEHLLRAEAELDRVAVPAPVRRLDLHGDGGEVIELRSDELRLLAVPADGGTLEELDWLPGHANLINSIARRPEAYHDALRRQQAENPAQLPGGAVTASAAVLARLQYDAWPASSARLLLAPAAADWRAYQAQALGAEAELAAGVYQVLNARPGWLELAQNGARRWYRLAGASLQLGAELAPARLAGRRLACEMLFNLLAPGAPDRYLFYAGERFPLNWEGELGPGALTLADGWRGIQIELAASAAAGWWVQPRYSVSQSESGYEAVYQGSALTAYWPADVSGVEVEMKIIRAECRF